MLEKSEVVGDWSELFSGHERKDEQMNSEQLYLHIQDQASYYLSMDLKGVYEVPIFKIYGNKTAVKEWRLSFLQDATLESLSMFLDGSVTTRILKHTEERFY